MGAPEPAPVQAATTPAIPYDLPQASEWQEVQMVLSVDIGRSGDVLIAGPIRVHFMR